MLRVAKPEGFGNVILEEIPLPTVGTRDVLVRNKVSLISRGSEILRRYMHAEAIDPAIMGYSVGGVVEAVGDEAAARFQPDPPVGSEARLRRPLPPPRRRPKIGRASCRERV